MKDYILYHFQWEDFKQVLPIFNKFYGISQYIDFGIAYDGTNIKIQPPASLYILAPDIDNYIKEDDLRTLFKLSQTDYYRIRTIVVWLHILYARHKIQEKQADEELSEMYNGNADSILRNLLDKEIIELYNYCLKVSQSGKSFRTEIRTKVGGKIVLNNFSRYLFGYILKKYCKEHIPNIETKLLHTPIHKNQGGRPKEDSFVTDVIYGTYLLLKCMSTEDSNISDGVCRIIYRVLKYIGVKIYGTMQETGTIKTIRARIKYLQKQDYIPRLGKSRPMLKEELMAQAENGRYNDLYNPIL